MIGSPRDVPPDVLFAADQVMLSVGRMLASVPENLVVQAYRRGREDGAGGPPDVSEASLKLAAKAVNQVRPGVETNKAYATIQALLVLGWSPPPQPKPQGADQGGTGTATSSSSGAGHRG